MIFEFKQFTFENTPAACKFCIFFDISCFVFFNNLMRSASHPPSATLHKVLQVLIVSLHTYITFGLDSSHPFVFRSLQIKLNALEPSCPGARTRIDFWPSVVLGYQPRKIHIQALRSERLSNAASRVVPQASGPVVPAGSADRPARGVFAPTTPGSL